MIVCRIAGTLTAWATARRTRTSENGFSAPFLSVAWSWAKPSMMTRLSIPRMTEVPSLASTRSASCTGTGSIMSTSPDSSAATAVAEFWIGVKIASVIPWVASPHQPSNGHQHRFEVRLAALQPEGTGAVHVARGEILGVRAGSSAPLASAQPLSIIIQLAMESGNSGCGEVVRMSTV
jgi:hypothetical protein